MLSKNVITLVLISFVWIGSCFAQPKNQKDEKGKKHGPWEVVYEESNTIRYTGSFNHGIPEGMFVHYFPDGKLKTEIVFMANGTENDATMYYPSGVKMAQGKYINKKKSGEWKFYDESGVLRSVDFYLEGKKHGKSLFYNYQGTLIKEVVYEKDIAHGPVVEFFDNGKKMKEYTLDRDTKEGAAVNYFLSGKIKSEGEYRKGEKDGWWTENLESGNIWKHERFEKGEVKETKMINGEYITYFLNGTPETVYAYKNGKKNGVFREYYNTGKWVVETTLNDEGVAVDKRRVLEGDKLKIAGKYFDDKLHGNIQHFNEDGKLVKVEIYQKGEKVSEKIND